MCSKYFRVAGFYVQAAVYRAKRRKNIIRVFLVFCPSSVTNNINEHCIYVQILNALTITNKLMIVKNVIAV